MHMHVATLDKKNVHTYLVPSIDCLKYMFDDVDHVINIARGCKHGSVSGLMVKQTLLS